MCVCACVLLLILILFFVLLLIVCLQCFDAVGWAAGRASGLYKNRVVGYWGTADATATHCLLLQ